MDASHAMTWAGGIVVGGAMLAAAPASAIILDDFEVDSSADYTLVDSSALPTPQTPDSAVNFAYDYVGAGIALAPNSAPGGGHGLRMAVNESAPSETDVITAFHNTSVTAPEYRLTVDVYMGVNGSTGTTEHAHIGVASEGTTPNMLFSQISGTGRFIAFDGDGGSSSDYRHYREPGDVVASGDASYLNSANTTNASVDPYLTLFPSTQFPGSPTNIWTTLTIEVLGNTITYSLDGTPIIQDDITGEDLSGYVSLGYADLFTSVGPQFVIYDNLVVEVIPEPASMALLGLGALGLVARRRTR